MLVLAASFWGVWKARHTHERGISATAPTLQSRIPARDDPARSVTTLVPSNSAILAPTAQPAMPDEKGFQLSQWPDAVVNRDPDFGTPQLIRRRSGLLSPPAPGAAPREILAAFIRANDRTMTLHPSDLEPPNARLVQDYTTRHNGIRRVRWQQQHEGLDIFGAHLTLNLTKDNEIINVSSRALYFPSVLFHPAETVDEARALEIAREKLGGGAVRKTYLARKVWYPLDMISCVVGWELAIECEGNSDAHDLVIRADTGKIAFDQLLTWAEVGRAGPARRGGLSQAALPAETISLSVFTNDSPMPTTPGPYEPTNFTPVEASRLMLLLTALDTNASPEGWIPDGSNELLGNNADVYADWNDDSLPDQARLTGFPYRVFDRTVDLTKHPTNYVNFSQVQGFYWANFYHDRLHALGFDEPAGNFQQDNFGRGGLGGDRFKIEVQNGASLGFSYANKAYYTGFGDGTEGKLTVSIFSRTSPLRDGALDGHLVLHEMTHGLTSRIIGNGYGLTIVQPRGMAEGWSDFFALNLLSEPSDPPEACYPFGDYAAMYSPPTSNLYFGIRRFPYSTDMTKAPQTFADTDPNQIGFPPGIPCNPYFGAPEADQVHNVGEVWCLALWECRANLIEEYGFTGSGLMEQLVVDGLKLTPDNPRFDQARDAILQADLVDNGCSNSIALWRGFVKRGLGYSTFVPEPQSTVGIQEAFDLPFALTTTVTEAVGDGDGYIEPGETANMAVSLTSHELDLSGVTGLLSTSLINITLIVSNAAFADVTAGMTVTSAAPFSFEIATNFPGFTDAMFTLRITSDKGWFDKPVVVRIGNPYDYPPEILNVAVMNITETNAWVHWNTGIPSTGCVFYGETTNYGMTALSGHPMGTNHTADLTNLVKGTEYHFQIQAFGTNGLTSLSTDMTFRTRSRIYVYADSLATQELGTIEAPFKSLQAAAEAAKTTGDEILVAMGTYTGSNPEAVLNLDGADYDLTITGSYAPDFSEQNTEWYETMIDGQYQRRGIRLDNGANLSISGVTITRGSGEWGGGVHIRKSFASIIQSSIHSCASMNGANAFGGGFYASLGSSVEFFDTDVRSNVARVGGGGFGASQGTHLQFEQSQLAGNSSILSGGVEIELGASITVAGSVIAVNQCETAGGGLRIAPFSSGTIQRSTFSRNFVSAPVNPDRDGGGGILVGGESSVMTICDSVIVSNHSAYGADLNCGAQSEVHASYCNIDDIYGSLTTSNHLINADTMFANAAAGDFHILHGSPCIDAGSPDYAGVDTDMDGESRPYGARVDMGADEFTDTDGDNMSDYWEANYFGSIAVSDGTGNPDNDGLTDFQEYMIQTDPLNPDTDGDEGDDGYEVGLGMNPLNPDQDNDGMADGWEAHRGLNPFNDDAGDDPDGDNAVNLDEYIADTDPLNGDSFLGLLSLGDFWSGKRVDWKGGANAWQMLEFTESIFATGTWETLAAFPPPRPITNAVVIFGLNPTTGVLRIRAQR
ncbi:MAG TPA: M36 family metallopeptidase [Kiritimatiellia bacterium]|nr:M36 family metallopeptidase [Kiritimatiellia bacterium]HRZ12622.1 M36 family metallopeptidase [Kiritimatiellia bacterium]HSA17700.1 M36 family metallopeptidase [Kiritimatiellia bacterium]